MNALRVCAIALLLAGATAAGPDVVVFPAGTTLPIRFLATITSGQIPVGARLRVQTMGSLVSDGCEVVPPYTQAVGVVTLSRGGRMFGGRGALRARFDSLEVGPHRWVAVTAVLDTLEYSSHKNLSDSGVAYGHHGSLAKRAVPVGLASVAGAAVVPVAVLGGYWLARPGGAARILAGEVGALRLTAPLGVAVGAGCRAAGPRWAPLTTAELPALPARTDTKEGKAQGDPINLVLLGSAMDLKGAFERAGWLSPLRGTVRTVTTEIVAGLDNQQAIAAPLSSQYLAGRRQDVAYELAGPNAKFRHHARFWQLDSTSPAWVGAATNDVGVTFNPFIGRFTHRIDPAIDDERDRIVQELEATGCADLINYLAVPGAVKQGRNHTGQRFVTDGRAAVIRLRPCEGPPTGLAGPP